MDNFNVNPLQSQGIMTRSRGRENAKIPMMTIDDCLDVTLSKCYGMLLNLVTSLKWNIYDDEAHLLHDLLELLPNLKYLSLKNYQGLEDKRSAIIQVLTSIFLKAKRNRSSLVISFMLLRPDNVQEFEEIEKLSDCKNIQIEELHFEMNPSLFQSISKYESRIAKILGKFLSINQKTLKTLTLCFCEIYLALVQFPLMTTLTNMELLFYPQTPGICCKYGFSPCFRFCRRIPNLEHIHLNCKNMGEDEMGANFLEQLFEKTGISTSVKSLTFSDSVVGIPVEPLFQIFPNAESFRMYQAGQTRRMFGSLCNNGSNIKTLVIAVNLDQFVSEVADLDSIFTGFSPELVDWMKKLGKLTQYSYQELDELRVNPSILDLKGLKVLVIDLIGNCGSGLPNKILRLAGEYAFKLLPKGTRIIIDIRQCCPTPESIMSALDEVSKLPNVNIQS